jgi:hypothetical protein
MTTTYTNPWHNPKTNTYGPREYETDVKAVEYKGYLIYQRIPGVVWDVVKDGVCCTQMAGPNGARGWIDNQVSKNTGVARSIRETEEAVDHWIRANRVDHSRID